MTDHHDEQRRALRALRSAAFAAEHIGIPADEIQAAIDGGRAEGAELRESAEQRAQLLAPYDQAA